MPSPDRGGYGSFLNDISCAGANRCLAVGSYLNAADRNRTLAETWNGSAWRISLPLNGSDENNVLTAVSCTGLRSCVAVGYTEQASVGAQTLIESWDGTNWSVVPSPSVGTDLNNYLQGVSCSSSAHCVAAGYYQGVSSPGSSGDCSARTDCRTLIESWDGSSWSIASSPNQGSYDNVLYGVSCASATACMAVGGYSTRSAFLTLAESWNGNTWSIVSSPAPETVNVLNGVACAGTTSCEAAGWTQQVAGGTLQTVVESWDGTSWSIASSPDQGTGSNALSHVSCAAPSSCVTVGYSTSTSATQTLIEPWDGTAWSIDSSPDASTSSNSLSGVSCTSPSRCMAVGTYVDGAGISHTLAESLGAPLVTIRGLAVADGKITVSWRRTSVTPPSPITSYLVTAEPWGNNSLPPPAAAESTTTAGPAATVAAVSGLVEDCHQTYIVSVIPMMGSTPGLGASWPSPVRPSGVVLPQEPKQVMILLDGIMSSYPKETFDPFRPLARGTPGYCPEAWDPASRTWSEADFKAAPNGPWEFFNKWNFAEPGKEDTANSTPRNLATGQQTNAFMLDAFAAQGGVILPFSYSKATLSQSGGADPVFTFDQYGSCDSTPGLPACGTKSIDDDASTLNNEIQSIHHVWPNSQIILVGHSQGGLVAFEWWKTYGFRAAKGSAAAAVSHVFTLDAPVNGVCPFACGGPPSYPQYNPPDQRFDRDSSDLGHDKTSGYPVRFIGTLGDTAPVALGLLAYGSSGPENLQHQLMVTGTRCSSQSNNSDCPDPPDHVSGCPIHPSSPGKSPDWVIDDQHFIVKFCPDDVAYFDRVLGLAGITEWPVPGSGPSPITAGPDGNLWFAETSGNKVGKITPQGSITQYPAAANGEMTDIAVGPDGNLWFTQRAPGDAIGKISTSGGPATPCQVPPSGSALTGITKGPDGNLWFTDFTQNVIGRVSPTCTGNQQYTIPTANAWPQYITVGPDGNLWFTEEVANAIGVISPSGVFQHQYNVASGSGPLGITTDPHGNTWFTEEQGNRIGKITPNGTLSEYPVPTPDSAPSLITVGPDGNIWFTEQLGNQIASLNPATCLSPSNCPISEYALPANSDPYGIATGPDGNIWFTEKGGNRIGRAVPSELIPVQHS